MEVYCGRDEGRAKGHDRTTRTIVFLARPRRNVTSSYPCIAYTTVLLYHNSRMAYVGDNLCKMRTGQKPHNAARMNRMADQTSIENPPFAANSAALAFAVNGITRIGLKHVSSKQY